MDKVEEPTTLVDFNVNRSSQLQYSSAVEEDEMKTSKKHTEEPSMLSGAGNKVNDDYAMYDE